MGHSPGTDIVSYVSGCKFNLKFSFSVANIDNTNDCKQNHKIIEILTLWEKLIALYYDKQNFLHLFL